MNDQDLLKLTSAIVASYLETNKLDVVRSPTSFRTFTIR
jgi:predicted transcriptional regulator